MIVCTLFRLISFYKQRHRAIRFQNQSRNKQTKVIITLLKTQYAYYKPKGFSGKNTVTIPHNRENVTLPMHNICGNVSHVQLQRELLKQTTEVIDLL